MKRTFLRRMVFLQRFVADQCPTPLQLACQIIHYIGPEFKDTREFKKTWPCGSNRSWNVPLSFVSPPLIKGSILITYLAEECYLQPSVPKFGNLEAQLIYLSLAKYSKLLLDLQISWMLKIIIMKKKVPSVDQKKVLSAKQWCIRMWSCKRVRKKKSMQIRQ